MPWVSTAWHWYADHKATVNPIVAFFGAAGAVITGLIVAWSGVRNARTAMRQAEIAAKQAEIASNRHEEQTRADRQRRINESYNKAIEQLGSENTVICCGGISTLERISIESREDHWPVMETLTAFLRDRARWNESGAGGEIAQPPPKQKLPTDIDAAITVIARRRGVDRHREAKMKRRLDLRSTDLRGAILDGGHLEGAVLDFAHLEGAFLPDACLEGALLRHAHLKDAYLVGTHLEGADLREAEGLTEEQLKDAHGDAKTRLPDGVTRPAHWPPEAP